MAKGIEPMAERMCILTRARGEPDDLIRFVAGPDGSVVPDLKMRLPGRGCWLTADRQSVDEAVRRKLFARALKDSVSADPLLGALVDGLLVGDLAGMMNMARKSGALVTGAGKVDEAVRSGKAIAVFHARDAAADGVRKLAQAIKARALGAEEPAIPVFQAFNADEMATLLGGNAFIHAAVLAGQAGEGVVKRAKMLARYRGASLDEA